MLGAVVHLLVHSEVQMNLDNNYLKNVFTMIKFKATTGMTKNTRFLFMSGSDLMSPTQRIYPYHGGRGEE
jgi:hypothetical protein